MIGVGAVPKWTLHTLPTVGKYLKSDGTDLVDSTGAASGVGGCTNQFPRTLNGDAAPTCASVDLALDTTGTLGLAGGGTNQATWTGGRCVQVNAGGTALESAAAACGSGGANHNLLSATHPDTVAASPVLGDLLTGNATPAWDKVAGNITTTRQFLRQVGNGAISALPAWDTLATGDIPSLDTAKITSGTFPAARGGTNNAFFQVTGPATTAKTFTFPNADATIEVQANKDAASGYAGLTAGTKLNIAQGQEVWALTDLTGVSATTGSGTTVVFNDVPVLVGYTVAGLPAAGTAGRLAVVTDASAAGNCTAGGGSALALCRDSGAAWVALGDGGGGGGPHDILSATHSDTTAAAVTRGGIMLGVGATPKWTLHTIPTTGKYLKSDGTEWVDSSLAASGVGACGANTWASTLNGDAAPTCTQPGFSNLSGAATLAQLPFGAANQILGTDAGATAIEHKTLSTGTTGTDFAIAHAANSIAFNLPTASASNRGALASADWSTFNAKASLVSAGSAGIAAFNAGDDTTASRSDHTHRSFAVAQWFLPGVVVSGTQTARVLIPEGVTNCTITNSRISVDTTSGSSSTYNIARCTTAAGDCTATSNIYGSAVTLNASTQSVAGGAPTTATVAAGDAFKVTVTPGSGLADVTVAMTYKCEGVN
jgi:hypothetical protein